MRYASLAVALLVGFAAGYALNNAIGPLPQYAQDTVCRSVCISCGECLSHRGIKLRVDRPSSRQGEKPVIIDDLGLLGEPADQ